MSVLGAREQVTQTVLPGEGMTAQPHQFGDPEFRVSRREIGHIHGGTLVDIPFPKRIGDQTTRAQNLRSGVETITPCRGLESQPLRS